MYILSLLEFMECEFDTVYSSARAVLWVRAYYFLFACLPAHHDVVHGLVCCLPAHSREANGRICLLTISDLRRNDAYNLCYSKCQSSTITRPAVKRAAGPPVE